MVGQLEPVTLVAELVVVVHDIAPTNLREVVVASEHHLALTLVA
jgi:hypothetical protein